MLLPSVVSKLNIIGPLEPIAETKNCSEVPPPVSIASFTPSLIALLVTVAPEMWSTS